jgi:hypothetical protein
MTNPIETLDAAGYRKFGLVSSAIVVLLFGLAIPWLFSLNFPRWPWVFAGVLGSWALLLPSTLKPVYIVWMKFGNMMNWINTRIILGIVFYGLILPFGLVMRIFGNDPMKRKLDSSIESYRVKTRNHAKENLEHPY